MSIFDNIKNPTISKEVELLIELKYGTPNASDEYLDRLPRAVISSAYYTYLQIAVMPDNPLSQQQTILRIMMCQPKHEESVMNAIHTALVDYETLLSSISFT
jgi:hypothetical protein